MIELIMDILSFIIGMAVLIWLGIFMFKLFLNKSKNKNKYKEVSELIKNFETGFKIVCKKMLMVFGMLITLSISVILAIGVKPIIYKLNKPLGEGYSEFASYVIAICLYLILPKLFAISRDGEKNE